MRTTLDIEDVKGSSHLSFTSHFVRCKECSHLEQRGSLKTEDGFKWVFSILGPQKLEYLFELTHVRKVDNISIQTCNGNLILQSSNREDRSYGKEDR